MYVERLQQNESGEWAWVAVAQQFDLENDFAIDEDNLNTEICRMGGLLVKYGTLAAEQAANLKRREEFVKLTYARVAGAFRAEAEAKSKRITEDNLKEKTTRDDAHQAALSALHVLRADAVKADHWWRSIVKKADLLNALAFRQNAEIKRMG
jgi:hypothetical protein